MKFYDQMLLVAAELTRQSQIVLMPFCVVAEQDQDSEQKAALDLLHFKKIDLCERVVVVTDEAGYIGESTRREIAYAERNHHQVEYRAMPAPTTDGGAALSSLRDTTGSVRMLHRKTGVSPRADDCTDPTHEDRFERYGEEFCADCAPMGWTCAACAAIARDEHHMPPDWPCATAKLVYTEDELAPTVDGGAE
ncbi:hypothetical protein [Gordonia sihwensis]|uniref:hypothetical protein n=1 Tax=Gordonia sihwensis TaxID=173559 RepID=UPI0018CE0009|nr:hypothetical protein [Gordonia sihwensis]